MEKNIEEIVGFLCQQYERLKSSINFVNDDLLAEQRNYFTTKFSKEVLERMTPEEALENLMNSKNRDSLVYHLEFKNDEDFNTSNFGGIGGGTAGKFTIFHSNKFDQWVKWEGNSQVPISDQAAQERAYEISQNLVKLHHHIENSPHETLEDVREMIKAIEVDQELARFYQYGWVHKYFHLFYPEKVTDFSSTNTFRSLLVKLKHPFVNEISVEEENNTYILDFLYNELVKRIGLTHPNLSKIVYSVFELGSTNYYKVGLNKYSVSDLDKMIQSEYFFPPIKLNRDLSDFTSTKELREFTKGIDYREYSATQINSLTIGLKRNDVLLLVDEREAKYVGVLKGEYEFISEEAFQHRVPIVWHKVKDTFEISGKVPKLINRIYPIKDQVNVELAVEKGDTVSSEILPNRKEIKPLKGIMREINSLLMKKKQIILTGAPGTGKSYWALNTVYELVARQNYQNSFVNLRFEEQDQVKSSEQIKVVVMHSNYGYEEFVEGLRPENINGDLVFNVKEGVLKEFANKAALKPDKNYYLILDEINRTDLTKVFGELIYSIENTKRGEYIDLSVSKDRFTVPSNLYIIGTMNNADKSVSLIDLALRRRFGFINLETDYELINQVIQESPVLVDEEGTGEDLELEQVTTGAEINISDWLLAVNERIVDTLGSEGRDLQIGHSYFLSKGAVISEPAQFVDVIKYEIIPLLEEYTYNNTDQLKKILGRKIFDSSNRLRNDLLSETKFSDLVEALDEQVL